MGGGNIYDFVIGSCCGETEIAERFDLDIDDVLEVLLDVNIESCSGCGWWFDCGELVDEEGDLTGYCQDCRKEMEEEVC